MRVESVEVLDIPSCSVGIEKAFKADAGDTALGLLGGALGGFLEPVVGLRHSSPDAV